MEGSSDGIAAAFRGSTSKAGADRGLAGDWCSSIPGV
jgi:hypothetical protein